MQYKLKAAVLACLFALLSTPAFADVPTATAVFISGTPALGEELTGNYTYGDVDGDLEGASTYLWLRNGSPIATSQTYTVVAADQGTTLIFEVTPIAAAGENPGLAVQSLGVAIAPNAPPTATLVSISGVPALGELLTGVYTYGDVDGDLEGASTYRWLRNGSPIATTPTYTVVAADQGTTLVFEVTPIAATGANPGTAVPSGGLAITPNAPPTATLVSISGVPALGELLTGVYTYSDVDGDLEGASTYRWLRNGSPIATSPTYTVVAADQGTTLVFEVTPIAATGANPGTAVPSAGVAIAPNVPPTATAVSISGVPALGELLTGIYTYGDVDGDLEGASTYRWLRGGTPIATTPTYTVVAADQGTTLVFEVTPIAATGANPGTAVPSAGVAIAPNVPPTATAVSISGVPALGELLTGVYTYGDVDGDLEGASTYRWLRGGTPIATTPTYTVVAADQGTTLVFEVTPIAATGANPGTAVPSAGVAIAPNVPPTATAVSISGIPELGELLTGVYTYGDVDGDLEGASTYRWLRGGTLIATTPTYAVVAADQGTTLVFEVTPIAVTGANPGLAVPSAGVDIVPNAPPTATDVIITGTPQAGQDLFGSYTYSDVDGDLEGISTYRWLIDGAPISGATSPTYMVLGRDKNGSIQFEVTPIAATGELTGSPVLSVGIVIGNVAPTITGQVPVSVIEDTALPMTLDMLTVTDLDDDYPTDFTLTVQDSVDYTRVGNTITPPLNFNGVLNVPVTVNDGDNDSAVFDVAVTVTAVNDAPEITGQSILGMPEDSSLTVVVTDLIIVDPDNLFPGDFTLLLQAGEDYTLSGNTINPAANFAGTLSVLATVSDGLLTSAPFALVVNVAPENDEPVVSLPIGPQFAVEGSAFNLDVSGNFVDVDNDPLTFAVTGLPGSGNLVFNTQTGLFSGTPTIDDARDNDPYIIVITATDSQPGSNPAQTQFELNISALDRANVSIEISVTPDPAMLNDQLSWTMTTRNTLGPQAATNVELTGGFIGTGLTITSANSCTINAAVGQTRTFRCVLGDLLVGGSTQVTFTTGTSSPGDVTVFASAEGTDAVPIDPNLADNSSQVAVGVAETFSNGAVQVLGASEVRSVAAGDVDGDGALDLAVGTAAGQSVQIFLSDGFRDFATVPISVPDSFANEGVALADFDRNGTLDILVVNGEGREDSVYSNDGAGNFTLMATLGTTFGQDVAVGDFNNDGNIDIVVATTQGNPVYLGNGIGGFALDRTLGTANSHSVAVGDLNGDGRDDIVFANSGSNSEVWLRNAGAGFSQGTLATIGDAVSVAIGELGGGAGLDLAFGRIASGIGDIPANVVLINDGSGAFASPSEFLGISPTNDIYAGDVNNDGLTDLVFVNASGVHQVWNADGSGFNLHSEQIADANSSVGVLANLGMTDVGDPGGVDLAMGGTNVLGLGVFLNDGFGNLGRGDAVAPELTLLGAATVSVPSGSAYVDSGATAEDNIDGDISASIVVINNVNTAVVGDYTITYNVSDFAGNAAAPVTRRVSVTPAAGTGGGGGGAVSYFALLLLIVFVTMQLYRSEQASLYVNLLRSRPRDN